MKKASLLPADDERSAATLAEMAVYRLGLFSIVQCFMSSVLGGRSVDGEVKEGEE